MNFHIANEEEIKDGKVTDVYFERSKKILEQKNIDKEVKLECRTKSIPDGEWGILSGLDEAIELLEDTGLKVWSLPEGTAFRAFEPVMVVEGSYRDFSILETPLLGFLCQSSGIASKAARVKQAADGRPVYHFGARRMHPSVAPMIGRSAYIGGCDGVAVGYTAKELDIEPVGTIPHALVLILEDSTTATSMFKEVFGDEVACVALVDTFGDEKFESLENADLIEGLNAVRLDTPSSRRGNMNQIVEEVRWELDLNGFPDVQIFVSGGLDEGQILELNEHADAYGVGTSISNAPVIDFALDIVEIEGEAIAKRGKRSGTKQLYVCPDCGNRKVKLWNAKAPTCAQCEREMKPQLTKILDEGNPVAPDPHPSKVRKRALAQAEKVGYLSRSD